MPAQAIPVRSRVKRHKQQAGALGTLCLTAVHS
jgi:hypothetical protein